MLNNADKNRFIALLGLLNLRLNELNCPELPELKKIENIIKSNSNGLKNVNEHVSSCSRRLCEIGLYDDIVDFLLEEIYLLL